MKKTKSNERQANFRWRCCDCGYQFTVRTGTIFEDSPVPMRKWAHAIWLSAAGKKGVAALELQRTIQVTYKTALFMLPRIRFAMDDTSGEPLDGVVEVDEVYIGGRPRKLSKQAREALEREGKEIPKRKRGMGRHQEDARRCRGSAWREDPPPRGGERHGREPERVLEGDRPVLRAHLR
ncbi:MAG TPA: hypothetical protein VGB15_11725 [Longimicrobium sp.]